MAALSPSEMAPELNKRELEEEDSPTEDDLLPQRKMMRRSPSDDPHNASGGNSSKRDHHNMMERQRRSEMDEAFVDLGVITGAPEKGSRVTIVSGAAIKTRIQAAAVVALSNVSNGLRRCMGKTDELAAIIKLKLPKEEEDRRVKELIDEEMRIMDEEEANQLAPWYAIQDDLNNDELAAFGPPPQPSPPAQKRTTEEHRALALRQHAQSMKYKEKKRVREAAIASGEIVESTERPDDEDDDLCYGDDPNYRTDRDDGNDDQERRGSSSDGGEECELPKVG